MGGQRRFEAPRCRDCGLHEHLCVCAERPCLALETALLVIQNNKERNKPTNTGRMLPQVLRNCELIRYGERGVEFDPTPLTRAERDYVLIFPRMDEPEGPSPTPAPTLDAAELSARRAARPRALTTIVLLDGTWAQCSRMSRRVSELAAMESFALPPGPPGHWGVRTPSEPERVSTYEAAVRVLALAEGPGPALTLQIYFDRVAAAMLHMKATLSTPAVPGHWIDERERRFSS